MVMVRIRIRCTIRTTRITGNIPAGTTTIRALANDRSTRGQTTIVSITGVVAGTTAGITTTTVNTAQRLATADNVGDILNIAIGINVG